MAQTQQFLYRLQPTRPEMLSEGATPEERAVISQHFDRLERFVEQGIVILAGRTLNTDSSTFGIVVFNAEFEDAARAIMNDDPVVIHHVMRADLFPYRVALISEQNAS